MKKALPIFAALCALSLFAFTVMAQETDVLTLFTQVTDLIKQWGGYSWQLKVGGAIAVLISFMKTSFMKPIWDKLGDFKFWLGPALGLVTGLLTLQGDLTWAAALAYLQAGAGAVLVHELLDLVKKIPGIGAVWLSLIEVIKSLLKSPDAGQPKPFADKFR